MFDLRKLFARDGSRREDHGRDTEVDASLPAGRGLEAEYESLIANQCRRWGIADGVVTIEVRRIGRAPDGLDVYLGMVRLAQWERDSSLRLLLGLPLLETKIRRMVRTLWIGEMSHFGGLWLHASEQLHATPAMRELRDLLIQLTPPSHPRPGEDSGGEADPSSLSGVSEITIGAPLERKPD
ncbi:hypothetical protein HK414_09520 [Ramlibacter terrae]|uniref:DUF3156 family protein n=1 Tax=Ramlibacter terrae TaxID=2732511 RepID=A0ABX6P1W3_9BURK|nr:hypothetical protein HK414_09520 [Ramlibacter terrae]